MFGWHFAYEERVHLVWLALALVGGLAALELRGRGSLGALLSPVMQHRLVVRPSVGRIAARLTLVLLALLAGVGALMRPQVYGETESLRGGQASADVIVVLDVSKSMLAEDAMPNRLGKAKAEIANLARALRGDRFGLVAFAGRASLLCPLTPDEAFFDLVLRGVDTSSVSRGGTRIGDAIRLATKSFPAQLGPKLIVLITDGEDQDSAPMDAANDAKVAGVRVIAVGLGSTDPEGSEIIITDPKTHAKTPMMHDGVVVKSRLDGELLEQIATTTEGAYVPAGTAALDLEQIVHDHVQPIINQATDASERVVKGERYPWLVLASIIFLVGAAGVGATAGRRS